MAQPQGPRRAATCSRAASWGSTTSASSIAARRCRRAATSSRPTAPPGWRSSRRPCSTWRWSWRWSTRPTRTSRSSSTSTWSASPPPPTAPASDDAMWDEEDGFFYDVLRVPGQWSRPASRCGRWSGLLPLCAVTVYRPEVARDSCRSSSERVRWFNENRPELLANINQPARPGRERPRHAVAAHRGQAAAGAGADAGPERVPGRPRHPLAVALSTATTRTSSRNGDQEYRVDYLPAESDSGMFGGNSNWRGPIWAPINALIVRALLQMYALLRRRVPGRVPDRLGPAHDPVRGRARSSRTAWARSSCATTRAAGPSTAARRSSGRSALARPRALLRVLPRRQRRRPGRQPPDGLDGDASRR